jgi:hypothetical protein
MKKLTFKWPEKLTITLAVLGIGLIYLTFFPVNYDFDGTVFSHYLRCGLIKNNLQTIQQPQHPLYMPINYLLYKALNLTLGYNPLEYFHLQLFSLLFGLLTLRLSYKIIREITNQRFFQVSGMILIAACYGIWYYSVEAEVHITGLFFITAGIYLLFYKPENSYRWTHALAAAACFSLAAGFHLTNGLIAISVLLIFIVEKKPVVKIFQFFSFYVVLLLLELAIFALVSNINLIAFYKNQLLGRDVLAGYKISYWSGFSLSAPWESLKSVAHGILLPTSAVPALLSMVLFLGAAVLVVHGFVRGNKKQRKNDYRLGLWILPYFVFFSLWDHRNIEFKLNVILPLLILSIVSAARLAQKKSRTVPIIVIVITVILVVGGVNFYSSILPANNLENNINYRAAEAVAGATPPQSVIVIGGCGTELSIHNKIYIPYFALRKTFILDWMLGKGFSLQGIRRRILRELENGTAVYFFSEILHESPTLKQVLENHNLKAPDYFDFLETLNFKEKIPLINGYYLRQINATGIQGETLPKPCLSTTQASRNQKGYYSPQSTRRTQRRFFYYKIFLPRSLRSLR